MLICDELANDHYFVLTLTRTLRFATLRTARATKRDGLWPVWVPKAPVQNRRPHPTCSKRLKNEVRLNQLLKMLRFADLVVIAGRPHPFPFRTRP